MNIYSDEDIESAVKSGIFSEETANKFRSFIARSQQSHTADNEDFRLVTGFNDIFVVIASLLLLVSAYWIISRLSYSWAGAALVSVLSWGLAEYFTKKRNMALPSIVLLLAFVTGLFVASEALLSNTDIGKDTAFGVSATIAAFFAWLHWKRFRVPITVAAGVAALAGGVSSLVLAALPDYQFIYRVIAFLAGMVVFVIAMRWDVSDRERKTRRSDVAFWLHLTAAPLLVHPVFSYLGGQGGEANTGSVVLIAILYIVIAMTSLAIDRRALMVSALAYILYTFSALLKQYGIVSLSFAITAFAIGTGLLALSVFWHPVRKKVLRYLPEHYRAMLPPV